MDNLEERIIRGQKAITLAKEKGIDTALWERELARLEALAQAQEVARRTGEFLDSQGWCLWKCSTLGNEIIAIVRDKLVEGVPEGYPVYTEAELEELCWDDVSDGTLRLVHEAKKLAGAKVTSKLQNNEEATDGKI